MSNTVNHPSHYNAGKIEVIEFIEDQGFGDAFCKGNAIKYIARAGKKAGADELEDLKKARWYVNRVIERLEAAREGREVVRPNDMNPRAQATPAQPPVMLLKSQEEPPKPDEWWLSRCGREVYVEAIHEGTLHGTIYFASGTTAQGKWDLNGKSRITTEYDLMAKQERTGS